METDNLKYFKLIKKIQLIKLRPSKPEDMTDAIMQKVNMLTKKHEAQNKSVIVRLKPILSIAASFFLILFIYQQNEHIQYKKKAAENPVKHSQGIVACYKSAENVTQKISTTDKISFYFKIRSKQEQERKARVHNAMCFVSTIATR